MTISVVNSSNTIEGASALSVTSSPTFNSTAGHILIVGAIYWSAVVTTEASPAFSDNGSNTWVADPSAEFDADAGDHILNDIGYAKGIVGTTGQTATYTISSAQFPTLTLLEVSGLDGTTPVDVAASYTHSSSTNALASSLITPTSGDRLLVVVGQTNGSATLSQGVTNAGTGAATWTVIKNDSTTGQPSLLAYAIVTADGSHTYGVTYNTTNATTLCQVGIKAFKALAGGGGTPTTLLMRTLRGVGL